MTSVASPATFAARAVTVGSGSSTRIIVFRRVVVIAPTEGFWTKHDRRRADGHRRKQSQSKPPRKIHTVSPYPLPDPTIAE